MSTVTEQTLADFLVQPLSADLLTVPGIGPVSVARLAAVEIFNVSVCARYTPAPPRLTRPAPAQTYQMCGRFLLCRDDVFDTVKHCNNFYDWLGTVGVTSHRATITRVIAEKMTICFAGLYSEGDFGV